MQMALLTTLYVLRRLLYPIDVPAMVIFPETPYATIHFTRYEEGKRLASLSCAEALRVKTGGKTTRHRAHKAPGGARAHSCAALVS